MHLATSPPAQLQSADSIVLIGYRATGKSTIGRGVAVQLGMGFLDLDQLLTEQFGPISTLVSQRGWPFFRAREQQLLQDVSQRPGQVIATGGGAILHQGLWPTIRQKNLVIWLSATVQTIHQRLSDDQTTVEQRPALTDTDVYDEVATVLAQREPLYRQSAHLEIATDDQPSAVLVERVCEAYKAVTNRGRQSPRETR